jgi:Cd2+/Zn2+-exporting ATPase
VGRGAERGILFRSGSTGREGKVDTLVFDKPGTITKGQTSVIDIFVIGKKLHENELVKWLPALKMAVNMF